MALTPAAHRSVAALVLAGVLNGLALPGPATTRAADLVPTHLLFWDLPTEVYVWRTFDVVVAIVAFPDGLGVVVTDGTSATVTLAMESSPVPDASLSCTSGPCRPKRQVRTREP